MIAVAMEALRRIREAGNNSTEWAIWAQKTAAWGMQTGYCPEQPKDAPAARPVQQPAAVDDCRRYCQREADEVQATKNIIIKEAVNRFLGWRLPKDFNPDCGVSFKPNDAPGGSWPIGTNLFTADQAKAMFEHCVTAPVPAAGVQGDGELQTALTVFDMGLGFALCHRDFGGTRAAIKQLQKDFDAIRAMIGQHTAIVQPDSGRDAALVLALETCIAAIDNVYVPEGGLDGWDGLEKAQEAANAALAAHPAPSSDAARIDACFTPYENEQHRVIKSLQKKLIAMQVNRNEWKKIAEAEAEARLAAHPANGARVGLSDEQRRDIELAAATCETFAIGTCGATLRAILAAAKKGT